MSWIDQLSRHMPDESSPKQLRSFGLLVGSLFCLIGLVPALRGHGVRMLPVIVGALFILPALLMPRTLRQPYRVWMFIGHCLGWVNMRIILTILFYVVFTPVSLVLRLIGRDAMRRGFDRNMETYRIRKERRPATHLKHQF